MNPDTIASSLEKAIQTLDLSSYRYDADKRRFSDTQTGLSDIYRMRDVTSIISLLDTHKVGYEVDEDRNIHIRP